MSDGSLRNLLFSPFSSVLPLLLSALPHTIELLSFAGTANLKGLAYSAWDINASLSCPSKLFFCAKCIADGSWQLLHCLSHVKHWKFNDGSFVSAPLWGKSHLGSYAMKEWSREIRCLFNLFSPLHTSEISPIKIRELKCSTFFIVSWVGLEHLKALFFLYMLWVISATALLSRCSSVC